MGNPFKTRGKSGTCNVCLTPGVKLTKDHVPPSAALGGEKPTNIRQPFEELRRDRHPNVPPFIHSKTGVHFPTVCDPCHKTSTVDDERLKEFVLGAKAALAKPASSTGAVGVRAQSDAIVRAVLFHDLTSRLSSDGNTFEDKIRRVVKGDIAAGSGLYLYIWPYTGDGIFMMHDFMALPWFDRLMSVMSFEPLTFVIADQPLPAVRGHNVAEHLTKPKPYVVIDRHAELPGLWPRDSGAVIGGARFAEQIYAEPA
jgi:hypothetical protein